MPDQANRTKSTVSIIVRWLLPRMPSILLLTLGLSLPLWLTLAHRPRSVISKKAEAEKIQQAVPSNGVETTAAPSKTELSTTSILPAAESTPTPDNDTATTDRENGLRLITTLQQNGSYRQAADFAIAAASEFRRDFTIAAFHEWGRIQPEQAIAAATGIVDHTTRQFAFQSVLSGWSRNDPEGMAETSLSFPEGDLQKAALTKALRAWMVKDPTQAGDWIMAHTSAISLADEMFTKDRR